MSDHTVPADNIFMEDALNQRAVYWHPLGEDNEGQQELDDPIEIVCRWEQVSETFLEKKSGNPQVSRSKVMVDRDLKELGVLWLPPDAETLGEGGALAALTSDVAFQNDGAYEIRRFDKLPTFDGDEFVRTAYL